VAEERKDIMTCDKQQHIFELYRRDEVTREETA